MTRRARRYTRRGFRETGGYEYARAHIEAARLLSIELGGTDQDVKKYFFELPRTDVQIILDLYEHHHGKKARAYASSTIEKWKSGQIQMGGQTASRLFDLLPPLMPLPKKYELIETLWAHCGPSSKKMLRVGLDATTDEILNQISLHIESVIVHYRIPESLEKRFNWLAAGDSHVKQELLSYLRHNEKRLVVEGARLQLPVTLEHLRSDQGRNTHRLAQVLKVGKHELEVSLEKDFSGVALIDPPSRFTSTGRSQSTDGDYRWLWWIIGIAVCLFFMIKK